MSVLEAPRPAGFTLPSWAPAEFLDTPYEDGTTLRAIICRLGPKSWQWSIMSIGREHGELIGSGVEPNVNAARRIAATEIDKCLQDPTALD